MNRLSVIFADFGVGDFEKISPCPLPAKTELSFIGVVPLFDDVTSVKIPSPFLPLSGAFGARRCKKPPICDCGETGS